MIRVSLALATLLGISMALHAEPLKPIEPKEVAAPAKEGRPFSAPLSQKVPDHVAALPSFGSIQWRTTKLPWVADGPYEGISGVGMVEVDGKIYVLGGFLPGRDGTGDTRAALSSRWVWSFDPESETWTRLPNMPVRREYVRAIGTEDSVYFMGGGQYRDIAPPYRAFDEVGVLNVTSPKPAWTLIAPLNVPRTHMAVGGVGPYLVVAGGNEYNWADDGYSHTTIRNTVEVFDRTQPELGWQVKEPIPGPGRGWIASVATDNLFYVLGGITWDEENRTVAVPTSHAFDPKANTWTTLAPPPLGITGWEAALYAHRYALAIGGISRPGDGEPSVWSDLVFAYDIEDDRWLTVDGPLPPGAVFNDPGVVIIDDTIYVLGAEGRGGSHFNYFLIGTIQPGKALQADG